MCCTSTEDQRIFWPSYRQWSRYHITVRQVNTATHAVHLLTQMFGNKCSKLQGSEKY